MNDILTLLAKTSRNSAPGPACLSKTRFRQQVRPWLARVFLVGLSVTFTLLAGCGSSERQAATFPVEGKVTYKGKPVTSGSVIFSSSDPDSTGAAGAIHQDGTYRLTTYTEGDGAPAGDYIVAIRAFENTGPAAEITTVKPKALVPPEYISLETTPVRKTVEKRETNQIDIEIP